MIRLTTALLTLGVIMATATTAIAQEQDECLIGYCNPEAPLCRAICPDRPPLPSRWRYDQRGKSHQRATWGKFCNKAKCAPHRA